MRLAFAASGPSENDFRADGLELAASVVDLHPPLHPALAHVSIRRLCSGLRPQLVQSPDAAPVEVWLREQARWDIAREREWMAA